MMGNTNAIWLPTNKPLSVFKKSSALNVLSVGVSRGVDITPDGKTLAYHDGARGESERICVMRGSGSPYTYVTQQFMGGNSLPQSDPIISDDSTHVINLAPGISGMTTGGVYCSTFAGDTLSSTLRIITSNSLESADISFNGTYIIIGATAMIRKKNENNVWAALPNITFPVPSIVKFFGDNEDFAVSTATRMAIYKRNGDTFTEQTSIDHKEAITRVKKSLYVSISGKICVVGHTTGLIFYEYDGITLRESNISTDFDILSLSGCTLSDDGNYLAILANGTLIIAQRQGNVFKKLSDPDVMPPTQPLGCAFTANGERLLVGGSGFVTLYER